MRSTVPIHESGAPQTACFVIEEESVQKNIVVCATVRFEGCCRTGLRKGLED